jgi:hypothetical protein
MLVVMMEEQLLSPAAICPTCLMADQAGNPRWHQGRLRCGRLVADNNSGQPPQYECQMGFRIANIDA